MTRTGKIARLPQTIRDQLNARLHDGEPATSLVPWLNGLPEVQAVLAAHFGGRPINEPNLSDWKQGGYADWLRHQEACAWFGAVREESSGLQKVAGEDNPLATILAAPLAVALGRSLQQLAARPPDDPSQLTALLELARELTRLRRCDLAEKRQHIDDERWSTEKFKFLQNEEDQLASQQRRAARLLAQQEARSSSASPAAPSMPITHPPGITLPSGFPFATSTPASAITTSSTSSPLSCPEPGRRAAPSPTLSSPATTPIPARPLDPIKVD